jgi:glycosyltransferase involved in cell wall biosynthesis
MRIQIVSDAWLPQINGVVRTLGMVRRELQAMGHTVDVLGPDRFRTMACPTYPEIRLALLPDRKLAREIDAFAPDAIHIATEGPLGLSARSYCLKRNLPFTTSYHPRFPEYVRARVMFPEAWSYAILRRFHRPSSGIMVATRSIRRELESQGFNNIRDWSRGVDLDLFHPNRRSELDMPRPLFVFVGRVAVEKNIGAFLSLKLPGTKLVIGSGPQQNELQRRFPNAHFAGALHGENLARLLASADAFVFPSRTDTFGLVMLEALASGVPVAAFPVPGPIDVVTDSRVGVLNEDLQQAALGALQLRSEDCRAYAENFSWRHTAEQFLNYLAPIRSTAAAAA